MLDKYALKEETSKKFAMVTKKIRDLVETFQNTSPREDEGMFTKKHYGPINCASCEKNLIGLNGLPVEHHAWKKLPFREPGERIARYA